METFFVFLNAQGGGPAEEAGKLLICILVFCKHPGSSSMCSSNCHTFLMESPHSPGEATVRAHFTERATGLRGGGAEDAQGHTARHPGGGSSSLLSTWHRVPHQWLQRLPKGAYSIFRKLQIADLAPAPAPPEERVWGLGAVCCDKLWEPAPHQVAQARKRVLATRCSDHRREEGGVIQKGAFRADLAYF